MRQGRICMEKQTKQTEKNAGNEEDLERLQDIKNELMSKYKTREGERIRSKLENDEKSTKYLSQQERT